jgi:hypothetical protein
MRQADFCRARRGLIFRAAHTGVGAGEYLPFPVFCILFLLSSSLIRLLYVLYAQENLANAMAVADNKAWPDKW